MELIKNLTDANKLNRNKLILKNYIHDRQRTITFGKIGSDHYPAKIFVSAGLGS